MAKYLGNTGLQELVAQIKSYVDGKVGEIDMSIFKVVSALPTSDIDQNKIYLVPGTNTESQNIYTEYIYTGSDWEKLGEVQSDVDLSGYVNAASASGTTPLTLSASVSSGKLTLTGSVATATSSALGVVKVTDGNGLTLSSGTVSMAAASTSSAGAMSASDKSKLDALEEMEEISTSEIDSLF